MEANITDQPAMDDSAETAEPATESEPSVVGETEPMSPAEPVTVTDSPAAEIPTPADPPEFPTSLTGHQILTEQDLYDLKGES